MSRDDDLIYDLLRRALVEGRYSPGQRLVEQRLAEEYDVSRTPVREAIHRLEAEGLVVVERHRGAQVRQLSHDEIADLYDVRSRLEAYAAELAAERSEPADSAVLRDAADRFETAVGGIRTAGPDLEVVRRLDAANAGFHGALFSASRHTRIRQLVTQATDVPLVFQALRHFSPEQLARSALFHHLIADAVAAREPARASRLMTEHVLQGRDALLDRLQQSA